MSEEKPKCEVCRKNESIGVACVPGVPYSAAYCATCLGANAHPWHIVVANTAMIGGLAKAAPWWQELVNCTLSHLGKTKEEFEKEVLASMEMEQEE